MLLTIIRALFLCVAAGAFAAFVSPGSPAPSIVANHPLTAFFLFMFAAIGVVVFDVFIRRKEIAEISAVYFGLLIGVFLTYLFGQAVGPLFQQDVFGREGAGFYNLVMILGTLGFPYLCISFLLQTKDDFRFVIPYVEFARELKGGRPIVLDATSLIDGRIAELIDTHMMDAQMIVPSFVIQDLQEIADSGDKLRRNRGRRGLDVLSRLQQSHICDVRIQDLQAPADKASAARDQKIIEFAKKVNGRVITNDFNLMKVAAVQNVSVINLNDVANAVKPRFLPGEQLKIKIIKDGESAGQGVGYLDDGTMVVVEQGSGRVGEDIEVEVTSVLQNSAGRMLFAKLPGAPWPANRYRH